jgi:hypothetical protein
MWAASERTSSSTPSALSHATFEQVFNPGDSREERPVIARGNAKGKLGARTPHLLRLTDC